MGRHPTGFGRFLCALDFHLGPRVEIALVRPRRRRRSRAAGRGSVRRATCRTAWSRVAWRATRRPRRCRCSPAARRSAASATAYVCRNYACDLPVTDRDGLRRQLEQPLIRRAIASRAVACARRGARRWLVDGARHSPRIPSSRPRCARRCTCPSSAASPPSRGPGGFSATPRSGSMCPTSSRRSRRSCGDGPGDACADKFVDALNQAAEGARTAAARRRCSRASPTLALHDAHRLLAAGETAGTERCAALGARPRRSPHSTPAVADATGRAGAARRYKRFVQRRAVRRPRASRRRSTWTRTWSGARPRESSTRSARRNGASAPIPPRARPRGCARCSALSDRRTAAPA